MQKNNLITITKSETLLKEECDTETQNGVLTWVTVKDKDIKKKILDACSDEDKRMIIQQSLQGVHTMSDFSRICNIPLTTCFRKIEVLVETGLLERETNSLRRREGIQYKAVFKNIRITVGNERSIVRVCTNKSLEDENLLSPKNETKKDFTKRSYRSELGISMEILKLAIESGKNGVIISNISRFANLSHYVAIEKCQKLIKAGFLEIVNQGRNKIFRITEKGISFMREFAAFREIALDLHIRF